MTAPGTLVIGLPRPTCSTVVAAAAWLTAAAWLASPAGLAICAGVVKGFSVPAAADELAVSAAA